MKTSINTHDLDAIAVPISFTSEQLAACRVVDLTYTSEHVIARVASGTVSIMSHDGEQYSELDQAEQEALSHLLIAS